MNKEQTPFGFNSGHIDGPEPLAQQEAFTIGPLTVEPALRRFVGPTGSQATVEPLVMQVVIALARAGNAPCSRDDLIAECWERRIVGDDSVNRVISNLRRQLAAVADGAVTIETIAKVGYRLRIDPAYARDPADPADPADLAALAPSSTVANSKGRRGIGFVALAALAALLGSATIVRPLDKGLAMAIKPAARSADEAGFAGDLTADMAQLVAPMTGLTLVEPGAATRSDLVLKVSYGNVARAAGQSAHVRLIDQQNGAVVWAKEFAGPTAAILRERAAYGIAGVIRCGLERSSGDLGDPVSKRLYFAACDAVESLDWPRAQSLGRQVIKRRPDIAAGHACLALSTAYLAYAHPERHSSLSEEAAKHARRALAIDPNSGFAYMAMAVAIEMKGQPALPMLEEGVRRDPEHAGLLSKYSRALVELGYVRAAVDPALRSNALEPNSFFTAQTALLALLAVGKLDEAARSNGHMKRVWDDSFNTGYTRNAMRFYEKDPIAALAAFDRNPPANPSLAERQRFELEWRAAPGSFDWSAFDRVAAKAHAADPDEAWYLAFSAIRMGDPDRAFAWLERAPAGSRGVATMFWPDAANLRRDRRFFAKMNEIGLVKRWRARQSWPDFCADTKLSYNCRVEAQRLTARSY